MITSGLLAFREGLEAALIAGIVLGAVRRLGRPKQARSVWLGTAVAVLLSLAAGLGLHLLGVAFEGRAEEVFEGTAMLLAAAVLTWMIFWMARQSRSMKADLERDVRQANATGSSWALFSLTFVAVLREGIELALFLTAAALATSTSATLLGGIAGLLTTDGPEKNTIQYAPDGINFEIVAVLKGAPEALGVFRTPDPDAGPLEGLRWGLCHVYHGGWQYIRRFETYQPCGR